MSENGNAHCISFANGMEDGHQAAQVERALIC